MPRLPPAAAQERVLGHPRFVHATLSLTYQGQLASGNIYRPLHGGRKDPSAPLLTSLAARQYGGISRVAIRAQRLMSVIDMLIRMEL
jgi:hypothetical protein